MEVLKMDEKNLKEEVNVFLISDSFFSQRFSLLKAQQSILTIISWGFLFFPFIWLLLPFCFPKKVSYMNFDVYSEVERTVGFLVVFF